MTAIKTVHLENYDYILLSSAAFILKDNQV